MKVQNKTFVVTGAGSGMGRELVLNLIERGAKVIGIDINSSSLDETASLVVTKDKFLAGIVLDITDELAVADSVKRILNDVGNVDGLINNAGIIQPFFKLNNLGLETIERVFNVNFWGTLYLTIAFLPHLHGRPEAHIINVSSMGGFLPVPGQTIYGAAKAGVKLLTEGLMSELIDTNVSVSVVFPGAVNTNIKLNSGLKVENKDKEAQRAGNILSPTKAAQLIIDGIEKKKFRIFVGKDARMMDFLYRLSPGFAANLIAKKMGEKLN